MNTALYTCQIMHNRLRPKQHRFSYRVFMFWLDIDQLEETDRRLRLFSINRRNIFSFRDEDHFKFPKGDERNAQPVRQKLNTYLAGCGIEKMPAQVMLLTHARLFGYVFNPVSFYFCYNDAGECLYVVTEISNTFGEMKLFLVDNRKGEQFEQTAVKYFYVSPFTDMDTEFEFRYKLPAERLNVQINVKDQAGDKFFISTLTGTMKKLSDGRLLAYVFRFPFVTLKVIGAIHWEAFRLWLKKIPYHKKSDNANLQKGITNPKV